MEDCVVEQFSIGGEWAEGCGSGVGEDVFCDDEGVGPEERVEDVLWDGSVGAEGDPGGEQEKRVDDEAAGAEKDPLSANECARRRRAEAHHGDAVEDPSDVERVKMEEGFAGANEHANGMKTVETRKEGVAGFVCDGERVLQEEDQEDNGDICELKVAALVAGAESDEHHEENCGCEDDVSAFIEATMAVRAVVFGAAEGEAFLGEGLAVECVDAADVAVCGDGWSVAAGVI